MKKNFQYDSRGNERDEKLAIVERSDVILMGYKAKNCS